MQSPKVDAVGCKDDDLSLDSPLPSMTQQLTGTTQHRDKNFSLKVSHGSGYLAHVDLEATWDSAPEVLFALFTHPGNSALFRDIKRVGERKIVSAQPGVTVVDVQEISKTKVLWNVKKYHSSLRVTEDSRDKACLSVNFELLESDGLKRFNGHWDFHAIKNDKGAVTGCRGLFKQDVLPAGVPRFVTKVPVLAGILRGVAAKAIRRIVEDLNAAVVKVAKGVHGGKSLQQMLNELCGTCSAEPVFAKGRVKSFQIGDIDDDEDEDVEGTGDASLISSSVNVDDHSSE